MTLPTRALSVHAPWAWALIKGWKPLENRGATFGKLPVGTEFWLQASLWPGRGPLQGNRLTEFEYACSDVEDLLIQSRCEEELESDDPADELWTPSLDVERVAAIRGHIIGRLTVTGYATPDAPPDSPWYVPGNLAVLVAKPVPLARPVPTKGALGWWTVPEHVLEQLKEAA